MDPWAQSQCGVYISGQSELRSEICLKTTDEPEPPLVFGSVGKSTWYASTGAWLQILEIHVKLAHTHNLAVGQDEWDADDYPSSSFSETLCHL